MKFNVDQALRKVKAHHAKGELDEARRLCLDVLSRFPKNKRARDTLLLVEKDNKGAEPAPGSANKEEIHRLLKIYDLKDFRLLAEHAGRLSKKYPLDTMIWKFLGAAYVGMQKWDNAEEVFRKILEIDKSSVDAYINLGNALREKGQLDGALSLYFSALQIKSDRLDVLQNIGSTLKEQGKYKDSLSYYQKALNISPNYLDSLIGMGGSYRELGEFDRAISFYGQALKVKSDNAKVQALLIGLRQQICDFSVFSNLSQISTSLGIVTEAIPPFAGISWVDDPNQQLLRAKSWGLEKFHPLANHNKFDKNDNNRIRVGYFSADFHNHATMFLISGLLREHNTKNFEIFAYSYGSVKSGYWRTLAERNIENFFDVEAFSNQDICDLVKSHFLDIAIDLKGYTRNTRSEIFQHRLAPIQINYLGYPSSMGANFIDYIISDQVVIPEKKKKFYSEKVICLPDSYMPNDNARNISQLTTSRRDFRLPEDSFVFCCFNNNYKISPREFDIWMRVLTRVDNSVLWLFKSNEWAEKNLRREAALRDVDQSRLVFADRLPPSEHLARHQHADLFIDTFNYNAHTTASDALWAGLPVVTKQGEQFAARVASSLLHAVGLPELVTKTDEEYENLILGLASSPQRLEEIRTKLKENRLTEPLFDTKRYTRNFELGLQLAYERYRDGQEPDDIWVGEPQDA